jgi:hypothetical protein
MRAAAAARSGESLSSSKTKTRPQSARASASATQLHPASAGKSMKICAELQPVRSNQRPLSAERPRTTQSVPLKQPEQQQMLGNRARPRTPSAASQVIGKNVLHPRRSALMHPNRSGGHFLPVANQP